MTTEANKANARRFFDEIANRGNLAVIDELLAPPTREGTKTFHAMLRGAFPDLHVTIDDAIAEGDKVVLRTTSHGTMKGEFAGMPPSGKSATWAAIYTLRFANGKIVEYWGVNDQLSMLQQLGFVEAPGQPAGAAG
jgi:Predicted ester cyclase